MKIIMVLLQNQRFFAFSTHHGHFQSLMTNLKKIFSVVLQLKHAEFVSNESNFQKSVSNAPPVG